jgi:hypothetical protein
MTPLMPERHDSVTPGLAAGLVVAPLVVSVVWGALMGNVLAGLAAGVLVAGAGALIAFVVHRLMIRSR